MRPIHPASALVDPEPATVAPPLPSSPEIAANLRGRSYLGKWRMTFRLARKTRAVQPSPVERLRARCGALLPLRRPVFILGCPRSGTTYLGGLLEALPGASYFFEPPILKYYTRFMYQDDVSLAKLRLLYGATFRSLLLAAPGNGRRIIEKNPNHTWVAETLLRIFPDAQFILITRDGRDTALSLLNKPWHLSESRGCGRREPGGYLFGPYPHFYIEPERAAEFTATSNLHRCIWIWRRHTEKLEQLRATLPQRCQFHVRYETLIREPANTLPPLLDFLGETDAESSHRVHEAAKRGRDSSIGRWASRMSADDLQVVEREAGELMRHLGYL